MVFLIDSDLNTFIQEPFLQQITEDDPTIIAAGELIAIKEIQTYLVQRWDVAKIFASYAEYSISAAYTAGDRVKVTTTVVGPPDVTTIAYYVAKIDSAGQPIDDTTYFTAGDNRDAMIVMYTVDFALYHIHSRISPRNIPQLRIDRYDAAKAHLKMFARGEVSAILPELIPDQGNRITYGGNNPQYHFY